jgi:hypothetical protein
MLAEIFAVVVAFPGDFGFEEAAMAAGFGFDFFVRKNEPICWRVVCRRVRLPQHFVHIVLGEGGGESGLAVGCVSGFHVFEGLCRAGRDSVRTLLVHAQVDERLGVSAPRCGRCKSGMDLRMAGVDLAFRAVMTEREHPVFETAHTPTRRASLARMVRG